MKRVDAILAFTTSDDYQENQQKQAEAQKLEREIDILVFKLYELTEEEIKVVAPEMVLSEEERGILGF